MASKRKTPQSRVLSFSPRNSLSPYFKAFTAQFFSHEFYYVRFTQPKTQIYRIERGPILPCHFYNPIFVLILYYFFFPHFDFLESILLILTPLETRQNFPYRLLIEVKIHYSSFFHVLRPTDQKDLYSK